jgi:hypothetical protein
MADALKAFATRLVRHAVLWLVDALALALAAAVVPGLYFSTTAAAPAWLQTVSAAFLFHPPTIEVPDTRDSSDVFHILNGRRGGPVAGRPPAPVVADAGTWSPRNLLEGIAGVGEWARNAVHCLSFDPRAYRRVVTDPRMTGPAVLIPTLAAVLTTAAHAGGFDWWRIPVSILEWWLSTLAVFAAGYLLSRKGTYKRTARALGFAQSVYVIEVLAFIPHMGSAIRSVAGALGFVAVWMAAATAHEVRGVRTIVLAILPSVVVIVTVIVAFVLLEGAGVTFEALLEDVGLVGGQ